MIPPSPAQDRSHYRGMNQRQSGYQAHPNPASHQIRFRLHIITLRHHHRHLWCSAQQTFDYGSKIFLLSGRMPPPHQKRNTGNNVFLSIGRRKEISPFSGAQDTNKQRNCWPISCRSSSDIAYVNAPTLLSGLAFGCRSQWPGIAANSTLIWPTERCQDVSGKIVPG